MNVPDGFITTSMAKKPVSKKNAAVVSHPEPDFSPGLSMSTTKATSTSSKPASSSSKPKSRAMPMPTPDFFNDDTPPPQAKRRRIVSAPHTQEKMDPKLVMFQEAKSARKERPLRPCNPPEVVTPRKPPVAPAVSEESAKKRTRHMRLATAPVFSDSSTPFKSRQPPPLPTPPPSSSSASRPLQVLHAPTNTPSKPSSLKARPPPSLPSSHKPSLPLPPPPVIAGEGSSSKTALSKTIFAHASDADVSSIMLQDLDRLREEEEEGLDDGLQVSPRKPKKVREAFIRGGLAQQVDQYLSHAHTSRVLWDREQVLTKGTTKPKMILHVVEVLDQVQPHIPGLVRCRLPDAGTTTIVSTQPIIANANSQDMPSASPPFPFGPMQKYVKVLIPPGKEVVEENKDVWVWEPWDVIEDEMFALYKYAVK